MIVSIKLRHPQSVAILPKSMLKFMEYSQLNSDENEYFFGTFFCQHAIL